MMFLYSEFYSPARRLTFESHASGEDKRSGGKESGEDVPRKSLHFLVSRLRRSILGSRLRRALSVLQRGPARGLELCVH